jgi:hypothetical protein
MEEKVYNINVNLKSYYRNYLIVKRPIIDSYLSKKNKKNIHITDKPLKVLEKLLYYNFVIAYKNPKLSKEERWKLVMDKKTKQLIAKELGLVDIKRVNTYISRLRKLNILGPSGIEPEFEMFPKEEKITYKIKFNAK